MTERMLGPKGRRKRRLLLLLPFAALAALVLTIGASAGPVGLAAGFEDDDADLVLNGASPTVDWNSFDAGTNGWVGTAPTRTRDEVVSGWTFKGLEDYQSSTSDNGYAGGTKQDDECASVIPHSANNKEDLKRIYLSTKTVGGDIYLMLAWVRIPQNSTTNSSNIGFEFNAGNTACGAGSDGLVHRSVDTAAVGDNSDMLIVYDFASGSAPTIRLLRWHASGACDAGGTATVSTPCWVSSGELTSSGFAEAKVNTVSTVSDTVAPSNETLGIVEFGEAGIDLTDAGVFTAGTCESFGTVYGVSRTSGNSANAQMKDIVGPGPFTLSNCGEIKVIKRTNPRDLNQNFSFTSNIENSSTKTCTGADPTTPNSFTLNDSGTGDTSSNTEDCKDVQAGSYFVKEATANPPGFGFKNVQCTASNGSTATADAADARKINIGLVGNSVVTCIYTNDQLTGAIKVTKVAKNANCSSGSPPAGCSGGNAPLANAGFEIWQESNGVANLQTTGVKDTKVKLQQLTVLSGSGASTTASTCFANLLFNPSAVYYVHESSPPSGYNGAADQTATISTSSSCTSSPVTKAFTDTPLSQIRVTFHSLGGPGVTTATVNCTGDGTTYSNLPDDSTGRLLDNLVPNTSTGYTCTVKIDP